MSRKRFRARLLSYGEDIEDRDFLATGMIVHANGQVVLQDGGIPIATFPPGTSVWEVDAEAKEQE